jgi:hypothetical protein
MLSGICVVGPLCTLWIAEVDTQAVQHALGGTIR